MVVGGGGRGVVIILAKEYFWSKGNFVGSKKIWGPEKFCGPEILWTRNCSVHKAFGHFGSKGLCVQKIFEPKISSL